MEATYLTEQLRWTPKRLQVQHRGSLARVVQARSRPIRIRCRQSAYGAFQMLAAPFDTDICRGLPDFTMKTVVETEK